MRKIIASIFVVTAIYSCSIDREITAQDTSPTELTKAELETTYLRMINSEEYKQLDVAQDAYFEKLNFNNSYIIIASDDFKDGALTWIEKHLPDTKFASLEEAKAEYENILTLQGEVSKNHRAWYSAFGNKANHENIGEIMQKHETVEKLNK